MLNDSIALLLLFVSGIWNTFQLTLFEIFIFCPKIQLWFPKKKYRIVWVKIRENTAVLDFLAVDNFDFTRKIANKSLGEKLVKMLGICTF